MSDDIGRITHSLHSNDPHFRCRVCGLLLEVAPWGEDGKIPSFDYCPCCGVEFGYGDSSVEGARRWRAKWLEGGAVWDCADEKPEGWSVDDQLRHVPAKYLQ